MQTTLALLAALLASVHAAPASSSKPFLLRADGNVTHAQYLALPPANEQFIRIGPKSSATRFALDLSTDYLYVAGTDLYVNQEGNLRGTLIDADTPATIKADNFSNLMCNTDGTALRCSDLNGAHTAFGNENGFAAFVADPAASGVEALSLTVVY